MKKYLLLVLSVFCCALFLNAQNTFDKAEKSFSEGLYKQAIKEYEPFLKSKNKQERYEAQLKTILAYNNLYQYDNALKTSYSFPMPKDNLYKMRYYLLQAQLLNRTLYSYQSPDLIESLDDPTKWTRTQKEKEIKNLYQKLWAMRQELILIPSKQENPYLTLNRYNNINTELYPTVYDYLVEEWQNQDFITQEKLLEESNRLEGELRKDIRELYKIKRLISFKNKDNQNKFAKCLDSVSVYVNSCPLENLNPYLFKAQYPLAKAKALLESAIILTSQEKNLQAMERLDLCLNLPKNYFTDSCRIEKENLLRPIFTLTKALPQDIAANQTYPLSYKAANIEKINAYIYKLNPNELYEKGLYIDSKTEENLRKAKAYKTFSLSPKYTEKYRQTEETFTLPALEAGFYYIIFTNPKTDKEPLAKQWSAIFNASELALIQTSYNTTNNLYQLNNKGSYAQFYALNANTGLPLENTKIKTNLSSQNIVTNKLGQAKVKYSQYSYNKKALAQYAGNYALLSSLQLTAEKNKQTSYIINTDSAIYKPGQEVKMQIIAAYEEDSLWKPVTNKVLEVKLLSPNGQEFEKQKITLDSFGTANTTFILPQEAMTGNWVINASYNQRYIASAGFSVEVYRQPEFEISFNNYQGTPSFNKPLTVSGNAAYLRGDKVSKAKVAYTITKTYFRPWFCWWLPQRNDRELALEGTTDTDDNGNFYITWTPKEEKDKENLLPARYEVKVFITDQAGNTIQSSKTYTVSKQKFFFVMKNEQKFFSAEDKNTLLIQMFNADEEPLEGKAQAQFFKLALKDTDKDFDINNQELFEQKKSLGKAFEVAFNKETPSQIPFKLDEGIYQLKLKKDKDESKINFLVVNTKDTKLNLSNVALVQHKEYAPGETALILIGNKNLNTKYVEIFKQEFLIEQKNIAKEGVVILELPIKSSYSGGIYLRWFGVKDYKTYTAVANIPVIYPNTKIQAQIKGQDTLEPGTQADITLEAKDEQKNPVEAKAVITVYDKALDYYKKHSLKLPIVYSSEKMGSALFTANFSNNYILRNYGTRLLSASGRSYGMKGLAMAKSASADMLEASNNTVAFEESLSFDAETAPSAGFEQETDQDNLARKDFTTTAYWNPSLEIKQGKANFSFKLPDLLTRWQILGALWTKDFKTGKTAFSFTTTKDLILSLQAPRFLREGDKMELRSMVINNTEKSLNAKVSLYLTLNGQKAQDLFKINTPYQEVLLAPKEQKVLLWPLEAPQGTGVIALNMVARAENLLDGEEKVFPLLPSRQRLAENNTIALKEGLNKLTLESLLKDKTLELETVQLAIEPSLIMTVLNAMPLLVEQKSPALTSKLINYYPLAVLNKLYQTYPEFKKAAAELPKRNTVNRPWQKDENLLLNQLTNSPWYNLSKGYKVQNTIDIFDAALVEKKQKEINKDLAKYQNKDGSFSWIQGGTGSLFMTLYYLEKASMAKTWDIAIDEQITKKALAYATKEIRLNLAQVNSYNLNQALYFADILTAFPQDWHNYDVKSLMEKTNSFVNKMTPLGKAKAALVWTRLGNKTRAKNLIASLMDSATISPVNGIYWAPEEKSWQWFNDSITVHSAAIKALLAINPKDSRLKDLTKWLIFQKGATLWQNQEQAATAVLTIFEIMKLSDALEQNKTFNITWNGQDINLKAKPFDLDENKFTLSVYDKEAKPSALKATVIKSKDSGLADFASLSALYSSSKVQKESPQGLMNIKKEYFLVKDKKAILLKEGDEVEVGSEIEVRLTISCKNQFDFVSVSDLKPAAFENQDLLSSWQYKNRLPYYQEMQNSQTNFYFDYLPNGTYELKYTLRPTASGLYNAGAAVIQSQFAPQFGAHSAGFYIKVK